MSVTIGIALSVFWCLSTYYQMLSTTLQSNQCTACWRLFASQVVGGEHAKGGTSLSAMIDGGQPWRRFFMVNQSWLSVNHGLQLQGLGRGGCISLLLNWVVQNNCCWNLTKRNNFIRLCNIFYNLLCFPFFPRTFGDNLIYTDWQRDNYFRAVKVLPSLAPILLIGEQDHSTLPNHDHFTASLHAQRTYIYGHECTVTSVKLCSVAAICYVAFWGVCYEFVVTLMS